MNAKEFLNNVCKQIKYKPANKPVSEELQGHIEDMKSEYMCKGYTEIKAEEKAIEEMGDAKKIGKKLNKIHRPKLDWITLILMLILIFIGGRYIKVFYPDVFWGKGFEGLNDLITAKVEYIAIILVILFSIFIYFYDYRRICKHSKILYILATALNVVAYIRGFRANGNLIYGLWPLAAVSPTVFSIPLYIIAFAGFIKDINKESKINITISDGRKINPNIIKIIVLSCLSIITSLMINFVSGFLVGMVYLIISTIQLLKRKQIKNTAILWGTSIILFSLLSTIICIIPTKWMNGDEPLSSAFWVGVDTPGKSRIEFIREETIKSAKLFGKADLEETSYQDEYGYMNSIQGYFSVYEGFDFLELLSKYGWFATIGMISIMMLLNIKLIINAIKTKDAYGKMIIIGIASLYIVQTVCNLAMCLGFGPIAEFSLPFISEGDASFLVNMMCMALVLSVYRRKDINFEEPVEKSKLFRKIETFFFEEC